MSRAAFKRALTAADIHGGDLLLYAPEGTQGEGTFLAFTYTGKIYYQPGQHAASQVLSLLWDACV